MAFTPQAVTLPARKGQITYTDDQLEAVKAALESANVGQGVQIDEAQESATRSATRSERMKVQLKNQLGLDVKAHNIEQENGTFAPAVSKKKAKKENQEENTTENTTTDTPAPADTKKKK